MISLISNPRPLVHVSYLDQSAFRHSHLTKLFCRLDLLDLAEANATCCTKWRRRKKRHVPGLNGSVQHEASTKLSLTDRRSLPSTAPSQFNQASKYVSETSVLCVYE